MILGCIEQILVFLPMALGIFMSYSILKITDMTVDGSFVLAPVVAARLLEFGATLPVAMFFGIVAAGIAGVITAFLQKEERISPLLAGILASYCLLSLNLLLLGKPNFGLSDYPHLGDMVPSSIVYLVIVALIYGAFLFMLTRPVGSFLRAFGSNRRLLRDMSQKEEHYRRVGLFLSNSLAGLSGCLTADLNDYVDCRMGQGILLVGIGTVVIGLQLVPRNLASPLADLGLASLFVAIGVAIYFMLMMLLMKIGIDPFHLKLVLGVSLAAFMVASSRHKMAGRVS